MSNYDDASYQYAMGYQSAYNDVKSNITNKLKNLSDYVGFFCVYHRDNMKEEECDRCRFFEDVKDEIESIIRSM